MKIVAFLMLITILAFIVVKTRSKSKVEDQDMENFDKFREELPTIQQLSIGTGPNAFFAQEALRFYTIAGTLIENFNLDENSKVDERYLTHILSRSLLENYFWILYIFDDVAEKQNRYDSLINSFKKEYLKLTNEPLMPHKDKLEPADPTWSSIPKGLDVNSMLAQVKNNYGDRLNYIYFVYRISSFDTHGKNLNTIFQSVFGKTCNFPILNLKYAFDLIANQYLIVLQELRNHGQI